jgi:hypothetical protein
VHKKDFPRTTPDIRPLVACVNTPVTGLSKWLHHYLLPIVETTPSYIRNSDDILTAIQGTILSSHHEIMSLDISALFTSIPTMEAFRVIKKIYSRAFCTNSWWFVCRSSSFNSEYWLF